MKSPNGNSLEKPENHFHVRVLGSAAGGGLPQWNCGGENSVRARRGDLSVPARSQPSIAVSSDGERWSVINASPDIRDQFSRFSGLHPKSGTREIPLETVCITNPDLDHTIGLLILRESLPYKIISTPWTRDAILRHNACFRLMKSAWTGVAIDEPFFLDSSEYLEAEFFSVPGKVPIYLQELEVNHPEATVSLRIRDTRSGKRLVYAPGLKEYDDETMNELKKADCRFVDGTFFTEDELLALRPDAVPARTMGHAPVTGPHGSLARLATLPGRSLYIHMNNTNPMLDSNSRATAEIHKAGVEIAFDGMEFLV